MSSDRGTIQRGTARRADPPGWQEPTVPAGRRVPQAARERKPALAALALLLIVGGALAVAYVVTQNAKRVSAIEIAAPIAIGQRIPLSAMHEVQIAANGGVAYVPWSEASQVAQFYAGEAIPAGTLLNRKMVVRASGVTAGKDVLGLALKDGQLPDNLQVGDHVNLYEVNNGTPGCPGVPGQALALNAVVLVLSTPSADSGNAGSQDVVVAVNPSDAGAVACSASNGMVGVAVLPAGGSAGPATAPSPPAPSPAPTTPATSTPATTHAKKKKTAAS